MFPESNLRSVPSPSGEASTPEGECFPLADGPALRNRRFSGLSAAFGIFVTAATVSTVDAGDILRGGYTATQGAQGVPAGGSTPSATAQAVAAAREMLARTTQAVADVQAMQAAARSAAAATAKSLGKGLPRVPNGLGPGGLQMATGTGSAPLLWQGANLPVQSTSGGRTTVTIRQTSPTALLDWQTFNIGKNTTVDFIQSAGGSNATKWAVFNKILDPSGNPTQILGSIEAPGQVYVINQNGIVFGGTAQVNVHTLTASSLPIDDNLLAQGLLNNPDDQFLFSALPIPILSGGSMPAFDPVLSGTSEVVTAFTVQLPSHTLAKPISAGTSPAVSAGGEPLSAGIDFTLGRNSVGKTTLTLTATGMAKADGSAITISYETTEHGRPVVVNDSHFAAPLPADDLHSLLATGSTPVLKTVPSGSPGATLTAGVDYLTSQDAQGQAVVTFTPSGLLKMASPTGSAIPVSISYRKAVIGNVIVEAGAQLSSPTTPDHVGGRIALIGANVVNGGSIATPDGQTILAAGEQVGFLAHPGGDASLRGLDVYVGVVGQASGAATNGGLIEAPRANVTMAGKAVNQLGAIDSSTSVSLNGRIDLLANYDSVPKELQNVASLYPSASGSVTLGAGSVTRILPESSSTETVVGTQLALPSQINLQGETIHLQGNALMLAPNANVTATAGSWFQSTSSNTLIPNVGQVYLDAGATIDVSGSIVSAPVSENIVSVQLLGPQLADSPLQRAGILRGQTIEVDIRQAGVYDGQAWIGTPLADVSGYAALIQRPVGELTSAGGTVTIAAGGCVVMQPGSVINVSGGAINYLGGMVATTRLISGGTLYDISQAVPDQVYQGIYTGSFTASQAKYGLSETYLNPLLSSGAHYEASYTEGANGGAVSISAPSMALDGALLGQTFAGPRQRQAAPAPGSLSLAFVQETVPSAPPVQDSPTPPDVVFEANVSQPPADPFALDASGDPLPLRTVRQNLVVLSPELLTKDGFGSLRVNDGDGNVTIPARVALTAPAFGSISLSAANLEIDGSVAAPGGALSFTVYDFSPFAIASLPPNYKTPSADMNRGQFVLGTNAVLNAAGVAVDDRPGAADAGSLPLAINGGTITINSYGADLSAGSSVDVSGGVAVAATGKLTYGRGGSVSISAGRDPNISSLLGGRLTLGASMTGFSGISGGSLSILAPSVQIGGTTSDPSTLLLDPSFFSQGGFSAFSLTGLGEALDPRSKGGDLPGVVIAPRTRIEPVAENEVAITPLGGNSGVTLSPVLIPQAQRTPVSLTFAAPGVLASDGSQVVRGDFVMGAGSLIQTDPLASVSIKAQTVAVLGSIVVPGGTVSIQGGKDSNTVFPDGPGDRALATVYLGPGALLSTVGTSLLTPDVHGNLTGMVLDGGTISISGNIVAEAGSTLNVSGSSGTLYLAQAETTLVSPVLGSLRGAPVTPVRADSNGGSIVLVGEQELFTDATLIGAPGGPAAVGGSLSVSSQRYLPADSGSTPVPTDVTLVVTQSGSTLPVSFSAAGRTAIGKAVLDRSGALVAPHGEGHIAIDSFNGGRFNAISLLGTVQFASNVTLTSGGSLTVADGGVLIAGASVSLAAPYVVLGTPFQPPLVPGQPVTPFGSGAGTAFNPTFGPGSLTVTADLIDIGNLSLQNIGSADLVAASGDIRGDGTFDIAGHVSMRAGQIYPATEVTFTISASDYTVHGQTRPGSVTIAGSGSRNLPLSAGGTLNVYGSMITQGGTLRAPIGTIHLGWDGSAGTAPTDPIPKAPVASTASLTLLSGSVTSVSAFDPGTGDGLIIPYGSNPTGSGWIDPAGTNITAGGAPGKTISIAAARITDEGGAVIDLRGGGDLYASRFVAGEGGSVDLLGAPFAGWGSGVTYSPGQTVNYGGESWVALQPSSNQPPAADPYWRQIPMSYAVIPGYQPTYAPYAPFNAVAGPDPGYVNGALQAGEQVYLGPGSGLSSGIYTLLPARYALLPGAFLVTPEPGVAVGAQSLPDASNLVSGYLFNGFSQPGGVANRASIRLEVDSQTVVRQRGQYDDFFATSFLRKGAALNNVAAPRLPIDAGQLVLEASGMLAIHGTVEAEAPAGGQGGLVDISSPADIYIGGNGKSGPAGSLTLNAWELSSFGAESLLVGGVRTFGADGTTVTVSTNDIEVNNAGSPLTGPDVILVANDKLKLDPGAAIAASGKLAGQAEALLINDVTSLGSVNETLTFAKGGVPISFPKGTPGSDTISASVGGTITLADGSTTTFSAGSSFSLAAGGSITLNAGGGTITFSGGAGGPIPVSLGDGTLLRVSSDSNASIVRTGVTSSEAPDLIVGSGAKISGAGVILDSSQATSLDPGAVIHALSIALDSGRISLRLSGSGPAVQPGDGLVVSNETLQTVEEGAQSLSLLSYSSIDVYGSGTIGSQFLETLALHAGEIRGFGGSAGSGGDVLFEAQRVTLDNRANGSQSGAFTAADGPLTGLLTFSADTISLGVNQLDIENFNVTLSAADGIFGRGSGGLGVQGDLAISDTPFVTGATGAKQTITALGKLTFEAPRVEPAAQAFGGLAASFTFFGSSIVDDGDIVLPSGNLTLHATGSAAGDGVSVGGILDVSGVSRSFLDLVESTDGGSVTLVSDHGSISLGAGSRIAVGSSGGSAGSVSIGAPHGQFTVDPKARLLGRGGLGGSFSLDVNEIAARSTSGGGTVAAGSVGSIDALLAEGGFTDSVSLRDRSDAVVTIENDGSMHAKAHSYDLSADQGSIDVTGTIDASGTTGGSIVLEASGSVTLENGAILTVAAQKFSDAGKGGFVSLEAGSETEGAVGNGSVNILAGSKIDLSVAGNNAASAAAGDFTGILHLRAPQTSGGTDVQVAAIGGGIVGASAIVVEGYRLYSATDGSIDNQESAVLSSGLIFAGNASVVAARLLASQSAAEAAALTAKMVVAPGAEIDNPNGNLTLANDWDLSQYRFGLNRAPGILTLRAAGDLIFDGTLSDGFANATYTAPLLPQNTALPVNFQSWSYRLTAGADFSAADFERVNAGVGSLMLGQNDPNPSANSPGTSGTTSSAVLGYYQVIRTGSGDITISAGSNVELLNQFASIYTAGVQVLDPTLNGTFSVPILDEFAAQRNSLGTFQENPAYPVQYSEAGGNVTISAQGNIAHLTQDLNGNLVMDSESELPDNWLYRRGYVDNTGAFGSNSSIRGGVDPSESTTWWIDFSNFFEGVGALGGGNVSMTAGGDVANVDAVVPTNARMPGIGASGNLAPNGASLVELGGGDLAVRAGHDINAGVYYVERGEGLLSAQGSVTTNFTRSPVGGSSDTAGEATAPAEAWLPTTLFLGKGSFDVTAGGSVLLGPVANPFLLPEGLSNSVWYKTYFSTYSPNDAIDVSSLTGDITFREVATTSDLSGPLLQIWLENMDSLNTVNSAGIAPRSYYQPWLRLNETSVDPFGAVAALMPGTLRATAFSGSIDIVGSLLLSPAPRGTLELAAAGSINGFQSEGLNVVATNWISATIDLSDSDPALVPEIASPLGYQGEPGVGTTVEAAKTGAGFLDFIGNLFEATESGVPGVLETELALHDGKLLHGGDPQPVRLYAASGGITGLTLSSPKAARVVAGEDITDVAIQVQNDRANDVSIISSGGDFIAYDPSSPSRQLALGSPGVNALSNGLSGLVQVAGPGTLEVLTGRNFELGGAGPGGDSNTTDDGSASIGNSQNPALPFGGADLVGVAGLGASAGFGQSQLDFSGFIGKFVTSAVGSRYLGELSAITGSNDAVTAASFGRLAPAQQDLVALDVFFLVLRDAGRDHADPASAGFGNYAAGFSAIGEIFPNPGAGDIDVTARDIKTESGGNISLLAPGGQITVGLNAGDQADVTNLGIVTQDGGNISIFTKGDVNVGTSRIFTLRGGNEIIWSSTGNIDAGASSKTVESAPPTRVLVDPQSGNVETDLAGLATGGGIGVLAAVAGTPPGNVDLIAPAGTVNAGDAGIRATGNLSIAAVQVLNAGNIQVGGTSTGVPSAPAVTAPNLGGIAAAGAATGAAANAGAEVANSRGQNQTSADEIPSIVTVEVLGYGGGEGD